jgi:tRNA-2-methylthio-N6-dimethylallyladenosine synthase
MTGCNNYCSYCIVPYVRGREKSRPVRDILNEIKSLLDKGVKEVVLLGQNVNSYSGLKSDSIKINFANLLEEIASLDSKEKFWIGFLTNHPKDMNYDIIKTIKSYPNISRHIHLPLQSGSNRILKLMNRNYTVEKYKELVELIRREIPDVSITTDLIVGFPTEQEEDFQQTIKAVKEIEFDSAFVFKYSVREKTKSAELPDDVEDEVKERRHYELLNLCDTIARQKNKNYINFEVEVLVVSKSDKKNVFLGKTINDRIVEICSDRDLLGNFVKVKIKDVKFHTLIGTVSLVDSS